MTKRAIIFVIAILAGGAVAGYLLLDAQLKDSGYDSCVLSIETAFGEALVNDPELSRRIAATEEWRTLDEEEERVLFDKFTSANRNFDCTQFGEYANGTALHGDKGRIRLRKENGRVRVR